MTPEERKASTDSLIQKAPELMYKPNMDGGEQSVELFRTMGMPEAADGYVKGESVKLEPEIEAQFREVLHKANVTQDQFDAIVGAFSTMGEETATNMTTLRDEDMGNLQGEWGLAHADRIEAAKKTNEEFFPGREFDGLNAADIKGLYQMSLAVTGKGAQAATHDNQPPPKLTPDENIRRADEIMRNPIYWGKEGTPAQQQALVAKRLDHLRDAGMRDETETMRAAGPF